MNNFFSPEAFYINWPSLPPEIQQRYGRALRLEIERFVASAPAKKTVKSIFIAGPSDGLFPDYLLDTLGILRVMTLKTAEISGATAQILSDEQLKLWRQAGINRLNSSIRGDMEHAFTNLWLPFLGRAAQIFESLAVDMVMNYELSDMAGWKKQVMELLATPVAHISIYFDEHDGNVSDAHERYLWAVAALEKAGFEHYSTYDFALPGYRSQQQEVYFGSRPYKGFGVGAASCTYYSDYAQRYTTTDDVIGYCIAQENGASTGWFAAERLTENQMRFERIMLSLSSYGLHLEEVVKGKSDAWVKQFFASMAPLSDAGLIRIQEGVLSLTPRGRLVENEIILKISSNIII